MVNFEDRYSGLRAARKDAQISNKGSNMIISSLIEKARLLETAKRDFQEHFSSMKEYIDSLSLEILGDEYETILDVSENGAAISVIHNGSGYFEAIIICHPEETTCSCDGTKYFSIGKALGAIKEKVNSGQEYGNQ